MKLIKRLVCWVYLKYILVKIRLTRKKIDFSKWKGNMLVIRGWEVKK